MSRARLSGSHPLVILGRAPLFFFVAHFYLAHLAAVLLALWQYGGEAWSFTFLPPPSMGGPVERFPEAFGHSLGVVYVVWAVVVLLLYPACRRVAEWKSLRKEWWVSYL